jgi:DNA (cytosine-5)-methyltransferase 1
MDPSDPRSRQVWEFFKVVEHLRPRAFVMENVKALATNSRWSATMDALEAKGESLGYRTRLLVLNAAHYGLAQLRERMFLVGIVDRVMPTPKRTIMMKTVRQALAELPAFGQAGNQSVCKAVITTAKTPVLRRSPFAGMLFNGQGRPIDLDAPAPTLPASMGGNRTPIIDQNSLVHHAKPWVQDYLDHLQSGGSPGLPVPSHLRRLTVEEAAHLQGFPSGMKFAGSQCAKFRQIGNSVPPALGRAVAETLKAALEGPVISEEWLDDQKCWIAEDKTPYCVA